MKFDFLRQIEFAREQVSFDLLFYGYLQALGYYAVLLSTVSHDCCACDQP